MTETAFDTCLSTLQSRAEEANRDEIRHQQEAARKAAELRAAREFAWRRLNILRSISGAMRAETEDEPALLAGQAAMLRETGLDLSTQPRRDLVAAFQPVLRAIRQATGENSDPDSADAVLAALAEFEAWHQRDRGAPFLALMEREIPNLPLVEV